MRCWSDLGESRVLNRSACTLLYHITNLYLAEGSGIAKDSNGKLKTVLAEENYVNSEFMGLFTPIFTIKSNGLAL